MTHCFTETTVEAAALAWLEGQGYTVLHGPDLAPGGPTAERADYSQVILEQRLRQALQRLNPAAPAAARDDAFRRLTTITSPSLLANNHTLHRFLVEGVPVEYQRADGSFRGDLIRVLDYDDPANNQFLAINQFTVVENKHERRPDIVLFVNGLPLAVIELKNAADESADIWKAFKQLQTYKAADPLALRRPTPCLSPTACSARRHADRRPRVVHCPGAPADGEEVAPSQARNCRAIGGRLRSRRFLDMIRNFIVFEDTGGRQGHQEDRRLPPVPRRQRVEETVRASGRRIGTASTAPGPDGEPVAAGVIWHTQGSGKSLTMALLRRAR
jgi:type I restriction enzyme R subunit